MRPPPPTAFWPAGQVAPLGLNTSGVNWVAVVMMCHPGSGSPQIAVAATAQLSAVPTSSSVAETRYPSPPPDVNGRNSMIITCRSVTNGCAALSRPPPPSTLLPAGQLATTVLTGLLSSALNSVTVFTLLGGIVDAFAGAAGSMPTAKPARPRHAMTVPARIRFPHQRFTIPPCAGSTPRQAQDGRRRWASGGRTMDGRLAGVPGQQVLQERGDLRRQPLGRGAERHAPPLQRPRSEERRVGKEW